jgi:hypothetical protein
MSITIRSAQTVSNGVTLRGNNTQIPPTIIKDGLVLHLDASDPNCYTGETGIVPHQSVIDDLSNYAGYPYAQAGNFQNSSYSITWTEDGSASYFTWPSLYYPYDYINITDQRIYRDFTIVFQPDFSATSMSSYAGLFAVDTDKSVRFNVVNNTGPWTLPNPGNPDDWADDGTTYYVNGQASNTIVSGWNILGGAKNNAGFPEPSNLYIGTELLANRGFQGKIAVVLMYNRILTQSEQLQNYNVLKARFGL